MIIGQPADARKRQHSGYFTKTRPRLPSKVKVVPCEEKGEKVLDLTGSTYGRLYVLAYYGRCSGRRHYWLCRCDCGVHCVVRSYYLRSGKSRSCGCGRFQSITRHGRSRTKEYQAWADMLKRCLNPSDKRFADYGGRGITVCARWQGKNGFSRFFSDMGEAAKHASLERINNDGGYSPSNCRWADGKTQSRNRRNNRNFEYNGRTQCLAAWAEEMGMSHATLSGRLNRGWSFEDAILAPVRPRAKLTNQQAKKLQAEREVLSVAELAEKYHVSSVTIYRILNRTDFSNRRER